MKQEETAVEDEVEVELRPSHLDDFTGQPKATLLLKIAVAGARERGEAPDHALFCGPPGLGKTTLASIMAKEIGGGFKVIMGPSVTKAADLASVLVSIKPGDILFVDEIHRVPSSAAELLYGVMEDFVLNIATSDGTGEGIISIPLPRFCLVAATTRPGMLQKPFKDRFGISVTLVPYDLEAMRLIVSRSADILGVKLCEGVDGDVARRSRGTPRLANSFLRRLRDHAAYERMTSVTRTMAEEAFELLGIDHRGLNEDDRRYLGVLASKSKTRPVGLKLMASLMDMHEDTIENDIEPFLVRQGLIEHTSRGRILAPAQESLEI